MRLEDGQAVQLEDGTTAFIHHTSKGKITLEIGREKWECGKNKTCLYMLKCFHVKEDLCLFSEIWQILAQSKEKLSSNLNCQVTGWNRKL